MTTPLARHIPALAAVLGEKPTTLYERQRELIREGLLHAVPGRGRGSGVQATPRTIATLVLGMLASVELAGSGRRTRMIADSVVPGRVSPSLVADGECLLDFLVRIVSDEGLAHHVYEIEVEALSRVATIRYRSESNMPPILFSPRIEAVPWPNFPQQTDPPLRGIRTRKSIDSLTIGALAAEVAKLTASDTRKK